MREALEREAQRGEEHEGVSVLFPPTSYAQIPHIPAVQASPAPSTSPRPSIAALQSQIRTLQAQIIASHVSRSTLERNVIDAADEARAYRAELGEAVRALKRARAETRKLDGERRKGLRLYEETRER